MHKQIFSKYVLRLSQDKNYLKINREPRKLKKNLNQREMQRMMKKAGISMDTVDGAVKVEIHLDNGQMIVINNPVINKVDVAGQTTFQVVGSDITEQSIESEEKEVEILEEDITLVSQQTGVDIDTAKNALEMTSGDLAQAIMLLKNR